MTNCRSQTNLPITVSLYLLSDFAFSPTASVQLNGMDVSLLCRDLTKGFNDIFGNFDMVNIVPFRILMVDKVKKRLGDDDPNIS